MACNCGKPGGALTQRLCLFFEGSGVGQHANNRFEGQYVSLSVGDDLVVGIDERLLDLLLGQVGDLALGCCAVAVLAVALPDQAAVFAVGIPELRAKKVTAAPADDAL